jgi:uncharacterized protein YhbP (UPF0306 family)
MDLRKLIQAYLDEAMLMQVATAIGNQPWVFTVYFSHDQDWNLTWISLPTTRHSQEIEKNKNVAGAIVLSHKPSMKFVRGLQFEGAAYIPEGSEQEQVMKLYIKRFGRDKSLSEDIRLGKNPHKTYTIKPSQFVLFDSKNFPDDPRQEYKI